MVAERFAELVDAFQVLVDKAADGSPHGCCFVRASADRSLASRRGRVRPSGSRSIDLDRGRDRGGSER